MNTSQNAIENNDMTADNLAVQAVQSIPNSKNYNKFLAAMVDPASKATYLPDGFSQPTICRSYQSVSNYSSSDSDTLIYYVPHAPYATVGQIWSRQKLSNGEYGDWKLQNTITNGFNTQQYMGARVVSSRILVFSDTISTTNAMLSGRITHISLHQLPLKNFDYQEMSSYTSLDYAKVVDVPLHDGTVGISLPLYLDFKYFIPGQIRQSSSAPPHYAVTDQNMTIASNYMYPDQISYDTIVTLFGGSPPAPGTSQSITSPAGLIPWTSGPVKLTILFPQTQLPMTGAINTWHTYTYGIEWVSAHLDSNLTYIFNSGTVTGQLDSNSYNSTTQCTVTSKLIENYIDVPIGDNLIGWRLWINDDQGSGVAPTSLNISYRYDYLSALLDRDLGERQIIWIQGATGLRNYVIKTYTQFQLIPNAELARNVQLHTCPAATWLPVETFKYLLDSYDSSGLRLIYTRQQYEFVLQNMDKLLNPAYAQQLAAQSDGYASAIGYASFKDFIKKVGAGVKKVLPIAAKVTKALVPGAAPVLGALGLASDQVLPDVFYDSPATGDDGYASNLSYGHCSTVTNFQNDDSSQQLKTQMCGSYGHCSTLESAIAAETTEFVDPDDYKDDEEDQATVETALKDLQKDSTVVPKKKALDVETLDVFIKKCKQFQPALRLWNDTSKEVIGMSGFICVDDNGEYVDSPIVFVSMSELLAPTQYTPVGTFLNGVQLHVHDVFKTFWEPVPVEKVIDGKKFIEYQEVPQAVAASKTKWLFKAMSSWAPIKAIGGQFGTGAAIYVTFNTKLPGLMGTSWLGALYSALQNKNPFNIAEMAANVRSPGVVDIKGKQIALEPIVEWITPANMDRKICKELFEDDTGAFLVMNNHLPKSNAKVTMSMWIPSIPTKTMSDQQYVQLIQNITYYYNKKAFTIDYMQLTSTAYANADANVIIGTTDFAYTLSWVSPVSWVSKVYSVAKNLSGQKGLLGTKAQNKQLMENTTPMKAQFREYMLQIGIDPNIWMATLWSQFCAMYKLMTGDKLKASDESDPTVIDAYKSLMLKAIQNGYKQKTARKLEAEIDAGDGWKKKDTTTTVDQTEQDIQAMIDLIKQKKQQADKALKEEQQKGKSQTKKKDTSKVTADQEEKIKALLAGLLNK